MKKLIASLFVVVLFASCKDEVRPKPPAFLALEYPEAVYVTDTLDCPYHFENNNLATISLGKTKVPCWVNIEYPLLDAAIFITYQEVNNNLDSLLADAQKLPLQHTIKADFIEGDIYVNPVHKTYGMFYEIDGDAASQAQFYVTDSVKHFMTGSLYFNQKPNFDSIMPAAAYLKKDMKHLMETLQWK
ncbi:gliding motility lipoprotein GldD [Gillisia sp. M10.2A]|uniref:Gliding motility lipoprotein GldD n=1 Tax=Gillisia lutea TaxID=2909668 RepID=A0ABS9EC41_9FLAO|nr:gliding motility lipoprotein GldD [Gillisia lutea]MCF4100445.1 gliding motility lipoprotein GldD [Gillisia lutea]